MFFSVSLYLKPNAESEKNEDEGEIVRDESVDALVDEHETNTRNETITHEKAVADALTVIMFYGPC